MQDLLDPSISYDTSTLKGQTRGPDPFQYLTYQRQPDKAPIVADGSGESLVPLYTPDNVQKITWNNIAMDDSSLRICDFGNRIVPKQPGEAGEFALCYCFI